VACVGENKSAYRVLMVICEGKRQRERPRRRWEDNIGMELKESQGRCGLNSSGSGMREISRLAVELLVSQERACLMEAVLLLSIVKQDRSVSVSSS
jgi:hypothetical protein